MLGEFDGAQLAAAIGDKKGMMRVGKEDDGRSYLRVNSLGRKAKLPLKMPQLAGCEAYEIKVVARVDGKFMDHVGLDLSGPVSVSLTETIGKHRAGKRTMRSNLEADNPWNVTCVGFLAGRLYDGRPVYETDTRTNSRDRGIGWECGTLEGIDLNLVHGVLRIYSIHIRTLSLSSTK